MNTLFISDLHLHSSRPQITRAFFDFLRQQTHHTQALYILGDFFDAWIGDDDDDPLPNAVAEQLKKLNSAGVAIFLMHGNRDFLLGNSYAQRAGATLIAEGTVIDLYGRPALLLHGDDLCTLDTDYMAFRQQVRNPDWQAQLLAQPLAARRALAAQLRAQSQAINNMKAESIMDVTPDEVVRVMEEAGVDLLIHGHTHRPARHPLTVQGRPAERIVLGDWHHQGWCLDASATGLALRNWDI
ncbi:UDP-2,3-diacylglucosamine diphosphatase [Cellvibrio japonicus]|uniref:UDP-2,3-diacylglucosamine hydrolase n=1 Tax=Cellvibrio japonicus (strain Ueda107) TaxID=498211 RepID=LPXH_CELJU|nr:UDP-2,3-diacylglucosamine diphosphatase [Cellvibrio japonicus]B3PHJ5.1 RecName: Full=UDP-2,3-diacylglucosamine hydrolase; AltName: Full=UDP-2,3-diacylglucosamine diphosphatase [Cellvibrio japonicus Ueda107]ACE84870.1 UDP-2,3-diacylglucosamine hydrolase [Cellvibrio japonicus Ueda107]QEI12472.1 UDP-2,3-diacylglucosamine diphosphatase [Cellvibrio japonicus]QEI16046.1 UDP-2,3-diacylglucosamine diphosphatase [Cellvibrio japonicus]QEI19624.1 UDP-2,3-diacylglucosamine diphosphatase [Cellvibrio jap